MKIALISDIHGNGPALDAVLDRIRQEGIHTVICLGDVALFGPQPGKVVQRLKKMDIPTVMGNTDSFVMEWPESKNEDERAITLEEIGRWGCSQLTESDRSHITTFQDRIAVDLDDHNRLLCYHGSPRSSTELLRPVVPAAELKEMIAGTTAAIYAGGHTHEIMLRREGSLIFINPGSVGRPLLSARTTNTRWPYAEFAVVEFNNGLPAFSFFQIPYPLDDLVDAVRMSKMPNGDWWLEH